VLRSTISLQLPVQLPEVGTKILSEVGQKLAIVKHPIELDKRLQRARKIGYGEMIETLRQESSGFGRRLDCLHVEFGEKT